jgi:hypothetical protein
VQKTLLSKMSWGTWLPFAAQCKEPEILLKILVEYLSVICLSATLIRENLLVSRVSCPGSADCYSASVMPCIIIIHAFVLMH